MPIYGQEPTVGRTRMPTYRVILTVTGHRTVLVEAESEERARELAEEKALDGEPDVAAGETLEIDSANADLVDVIMFVEGYAPRSDRTASSSTARPWRPRDRNRGVQNGQV